MKTLGDSKWSAILVFFVMFAFTLSLSFFAKQTARERSEFRVILTPAAAQGVRPAVLDLANQLLPKKLVQPSKVSVTTGHRGGIINKTQEALWIEVATRGFESKHQIDSLNIHFNKVERRLMTPLNPGEGFIFSVDLELPKDKLKESTVDSGVIEIINYQTGQLLAEVPVSIINSRAN